MKSKKIFRLGAILLAIIICFTSCSKPSEPKSNKADEKNEVAEKNEANEKVEKLREVLKDLGFLDGIDIDWNKPIAMADLQQLSMNLGVDLMKDDGKDNVLTAMEFYARLAELFEEEMNEANLTPREAYKQLDEKAALQMEYLTQKGFVYAPENFQPKGEITGNQALQALVRYSSELSDLRNRRYLVTTQGVNKEKNEDIKKAETLYLCSAYRFMLFMDTFTNKAEMESLSDEEFEKLLKDYCVAFQDLVGAEAILKETYKSNGIASEELSEYYGWFWSDSEEEKKLKEEKKKKEEEAFKTAQYIDSLVKDGNTHPVKTVMEKLGVSKEEAFKMWSTSQQVISGKYSDRAKTMDFLYKSATVVKTTSKVAFIVAGAIATAGTAAAAAGAASATTATFTTGETIGLAVSGIDAAVNVADTVLIVSGKEGSKGQQFTENFGKVTGFASAVTGGVVGGFIPKIATTRDVADTIQTLGDLADGTIVGISVTDNYTLTNAISSGFKKASDYSDKANRQEAINCIEKRDLMTSTQGEFVEQLKKDLEAVEIPDREGYYSDEQKKELGEEAKKFDENMKQEEEKKIAKEEEQKKKEEEKKKKKKQQQEEEQPKPSAKKRKKNTQKKQPVKKAPQPAPQEENNEPAGNYAPAGDFEEEWERYHKMYDNPHPIDPHSSDPHSQGQMDYNPDHGHYNDNTKVYQDPSNPDHYWTIERID